MGEIEFLVGVSGGQPQSLQDYITQLRDRSRLFRTAYEDGDMVQAGRASEGVMGLFDHIVGELMRVRDDLKGGIRPPNGPFASALSAPLGRLAPTSSRADHLAVRNLGPGNGDISANLSTQPSTLEKVLLKVKHQNAAFGNFRIENRRHVLLVCADHPPGPPESIVEFDVVTFCDLCEAAAAVR